MNPLENDIAEVLIPEDVLMKRVGNLARKSVPITRVWKSR